MFVLKKKYFLIIENTKDINLNDIKLHKKISIIYRNKKESENITKILKFRKRCKLKKIKFYVSNNSKLMALVKADGIYISSYNKDLSLNKFKRINYEIIGSAHNIKEINLKIIQGCTYILVSRLFKTVYKNKKDFFGVIKFNLLKLNRKQELVPLGGIRISNLNKLNSVSSNSLALLSEVKKKPAKIINRLF